MKGKIFTTDFHDVFTFDKNTNTISAEISSLQCLSYNPSINRIVAEVQSLDDEPGIEFSKHVPFIIRSSVTGIPKAFYLYKTDQNDEGEIYGWWFATTDKKFKFLLIND